jgi:hypothetical protein
VHLKSIALTVFSILSFTACDRDAQVNFYDKSIKRLPCLSFTAQDSKLDKELLKLYKFDKECRYKLYLEYKSDIVCNSSFNAPRKSFSNFPTAYIKLEVKDGFRLIYSYYKDLTDRPDRDDLKNGFLRLKSDLL